MMDTVAEALKRDLGDRALPEVHDDLKPRVQQVMALYTGNLASPVFGDLIDLGVDPDVAANMAIHLLVTEAARFAILSCHAFANRAPRRDFWIASTTEAFDDAVEWYENHGRHAVDEYRRSVLPSTFATAPADAAALTSPLSGEDRQAPRAEGDRLAELGEGSKDG